MSTPNSVAPRHPPSRWTSDRCMAGEPCLPSLSSQAELASWEKCHRDSRPGELPGEGRSRGRSCPSRRGGPPDVTATSPTGSGPKGGCFRRSMTDPWCGKHHEISIYIVTSRNIYIYILDIDIRSLNKNSSNNQACPTFLPFKLFQFGFEI